MSRLSLSIRTEMRLTPALLNLARLLELPGMQLYQAVQAELMSNPALEEVEQDHRPCVRCGGPTLERICLRCAGEGLLDEQIERGAVAQERVLMVAAPRSPADALLEDLRASLPASDHSIARAVIGSLDEHGLLSDEPRSLARMLGVEVGRVESVLGQLQQLGPPGIAAHSARDCLLAQIDALADTGKHCPHARVIIALHFEDLGKHRYQAIARQLHVTTTEVAAAHDFIQRMLWPYPLQSEADVGHAPDLRLYRTPDILFDWFDARISVEVVAGNTVLRASPIYEELNGRAASLEADERAHVQHYLGRAQMFLRNLRQRAQTLLRVGEALASRQEAFLRHGVRQLIPLTRLQIAHDIGLHESTVCRAVSDKVARLPNRELWPMDDFFAAARPVQDVLRELIEGETRALNDGELAELLAQRGYPIARRTVGKYREQLGVLPHHQRQIVKANSTGAPGQPSRG
jgi:RNA polymerase sigma-54 factor